MAFALDATKLGRIANDQPAIASDLNSLFSEIEDELNGVHNLADDSVATINIRPDAVTQEKIDLSGFTPSADEDPVTKTYLDTYVDENASALYGLQSLATTDEDSTALEYDKYDSTAESIVEHIYQANADGYLTVIARTLNNSGVISNSYYGRLMVWSGDVSVLNYSLEGIDFSTFDKDEWDITLPPLNSGAFLKYDNYFRGGPVTAIVPIKKNEYFKVMTVRRNTDNNRFANINGATDYMSVYMKWQGIASNSKPGVA